MLWPWHGDVFSHLRHGKIRQLPTARRNTIFTMAFWFRTVDAFLKCQCNGYCVRDPLWKAVRLIWILTWSKFNITIRLFRHCHAPCAGCGKAHAFSYVLLCKLFPFCAPKSFPPPRNTSFFIVCFQSCTWIFIFATVYRSTFISNSTSDFRSFFQTEISNI